MIISGSQDDEARYTVTTDTALDSEVYQALIASLKVRIVDLFGGYAQWSSSTSTHKPELESFL